ncbi:MAG: hypothetical protein GY842_13665 [bacterium]|nr:hypothetical protein [bacterium]
MRTTLTLDDDVAILLNQARTRQRRTLKEVVNEALRRGLPQLDTAARRISRPYSTPTVSVGRCFVDDVDDVAAALVLGEGEAFK